MAESILILDDEPGITMLCNRLLTRAGYDVVAFTEVQPALEYLRANPIGLLLVDIRMPEMDGFNVISHAKQLQPDIAILVMTGFGTVETAIQALRQGVDGLLLKPFEQGDELIGAVKQAFTDSQKKHDAARIQALRPLFNVTDSLLSETNPDRLLKLIVQAIQGHLRCAQAGFYQFVGDDAELKLMAWQGKKIDLNNILQKAGGVETFDSPIMVNVVGPGDPDIQSFLSDQGVGAALFVPVLRINTRIILYAGRSLNDNSFREADLELFLILANQAAVAMENARLYAELREYVKQVEESQQALLQAEKMAAVGRLTASIAHEVNNPLQSVQNCIHLAGRSDLPDDQRQEYFELAKSELNRLMSTVQRMLDFYRPGAVAPSKIDVVELLKYVVGLMSQQLDQQKVEIDLEVSGSIPQILAVGSQVQQVFINLILNAADAMLDGGKIIIGVKSLKKGIEILFKDNGPGIPGEGLANIFEPFYSTKTGGTGLGLTVSYNIVTAHGGTLDLISGSELGACFRVVLPAGRKYEK